MYGLMYSTFILLPYVRGIDQLQIGYMSFNSKVIIIFDSVTVFTSKTGKTYSILFKQTKKKVLCVSAKQQRGGAVMK